HPVGDHTEDDILALAAAAETDSEHPLATAIVGAARTRDLDVPGATDFSSSPAVGVKATVKDTVIEVGGPYLLRSEEHTSELQSRFDLVCRLLLEKKKNKTELNVIA